MANCEAAVQRFQARQQAEQQGIQAMGDAISSALTSPQAAPLDSQSNLATYEDESQGQPVLGDGSSSSLPADSSAAGIMAPDTNSDAGKDSVQAQLDAEIDRAMAQGSEQNPQLGNASDPTAADRYRANSTEGVSVGRGDQISRSPNNDDALVNGDSQNRSPQDGLTVGTTYVANEGIARVVPGGDYYIDAQNIASGNTQQQVDGIFDLAAKGNEHGNTNEASKFVVGKLLTPIHNAFSNAFNLLDSAFQTCATSPDPNCTTSNSPLDQQWNHIQNQGIFSAPITNDWSNAFQ